MVRFIVNRIGSLIGVLIVLSIVVFVVQRISGADPVRAYLGANSSAAAVERMREHLGLDQPLFKQYLDYVWNALHGNLGFSLSTQRPVTTELAARVPATFELATWAIVLSVIIAIVLSRLYSVRGWGGGIIRFIFFSAASAPSFLLATAGLLLFFGQLHVLPAQGRTSFPPLTGPTGFYVLDGLLDGDPLYAWDAVQHLFLPALAASIGPGIALARVLADGLDTGGKSGYAKTARSLGETEGAILFRHSLRNASSPAMSFLGVQIGLMLSSLVVVEQIFSWNGLGQYLTAAISVADLASVAAISLILGGAYVLINSIVDILLAVVDPRLRTL